MKKCFNCLAEKPISDYYKHSGMSDGHLNKCKECCKSQARNYHKVMSADTNWVVKERIRAIEKNRRSKSGGFATVTSESKRKSKSEWAERNPEKINGSNVRNYYKRFMDIDRDVELHHWSYNEDHVRDVIFLNKKDHKLIHCFIFYDEASKMYKDVNGVLLDSNLKHYQYFQKVKNGELHLRDVRLSSINASDFSLKRNNLKINNQCNQNRKYPTPPKHVTSFRP